MREKLGSTRGASFTETATAHLASASLLEYRLHLRSARVTSKNDASRRSEPVDMDPDALHLPDSARRARLAAPFFSIGSAMDVPSSRPFGDLDQNATSQLTKAVMCREVRLAMSALRASA